MNLEPNTCILMSLSPKIGYNKVRRQCLKFHDFGGQSSKNVHDVRKVCLYMCLSVLVYFVMFYVFVLDEIDVE